jgi:hypothetical protein
VCTQLEPKQDSDQYKQLLEIKPSQTEGCICDNVKLFLNWENVTHSGQIAMIMLITTEQIDKELTKKKKTEKTPKTELPTKEKLPPKTVRVTHALSPENTTPTIEHHRLPDATRHDKGNGT